jgi:hypothetical protein
MNKSSRLRHNNPARLLTIYIATLLCAAGLIFPCAHAQETDATRQRFRETKVKAEKGDAESQHMVGFCYTMGLNVEKDYVEASKWHRKAAEQNHVRAQCCVGVAYQFGKGVKKDYVEAYAWLNLAAETYDRAVMGRDDLEKWMSPQQVVDAKKRTKELRAQIDAKLKSGGK